MKVLLLTKGKMHLAGNTLTFDGIFSYGTDEYMGIKWAEMEELILVGFESKEPFTGQKVSFDKTKVSVVGLDPNLAKREAGLIGRLRNAVAFSILIIKNRDILRRADILITPYYEYCGFLLFAFKLAGGRAKIIEDVITDYPSWNFAKKHSYLQKRYLLLHQRLTYLLSDEVWFISDYLFKKYPTKKGLVVYNSPLAKDMIRPPKELAPGGHIKLIFIGRFAGEKLPDVPVLVLDELKKGGYQATLSFIGDGPLRPDVEVLVATRGLRDEVHFLGQIFDRAELFKILRESDFFIFPSMLGEALGFVVIEAMSQGLIVLGTAAGGIREVIKDSDNGFLIEPIDDRTKKDALAHWMAERISRLVSDPDEYKKMSQRAVDTVTEFTIEKCAEIQRSRILALLKRTS